MILNFGVIEQPYSTESYGAATKRRKIGLAKRGKANAPRAKSSGGMKTTGDVGKILEDKYHIMEIFYEETGAETIAGLLENSLARTMESILHGGPATMRFSAQAESRIETVFRLWLGRRGLDGIEPGVPTKAAQRGVNHRFLHPYAKRAPRPSFIDTGLYQANMKVWTEV